jgi:hypothetical protein
VVRWAIVAYLAALGLHAPSLLRPMLCFDDFPIVVESWTWAAVQDNLWRPFNEHTMPLGRVSTWALARLAGPTTWLPLATACQGPAAVLIGMTLVYLFIRREFGQQFIALVALILFGVTTVYVQAVCWFASSFSVLALDTLLLALLAAQSWRQTGNSLQLIMSAVWSAFAPGWFAIGILAGPLCCLYLFPREPGRRRAGALVPLFGSILFLAITLPQTAEHIMHLEHYAGKTALEAFDPVVGLQNTCRSLADNLLLGPLGITGKALPVGWVLLGLSGLATAAVWWWRRATQRRLLLLGLGLILASDLLVYSARSSSWSYEAQVHYWTRYNLLPHLGLTFFICGGLHSMAADRTAPLGPRQGKLLVFLLAALFALNLPRGIVAGWGYDPEQQRVLRQIDAMDARCREFHIDAATARQVLGILPVPYCGDDSNGWKLLRGSAEPRTLTLEEARRLLVPPQGEPLAGSAGSSPR